jgi:hypothetical protein
MVLKFLHIAFIFGGITLIYGTEILLHRIGRSGDTRAIRTAFSMAKPVVMIGPAMFWIGVAFGLTAGVVNGYNLLAPWLVATYALVGTLLVAGLTITVPWLNRVGALAAAAPDGPASPELSAALHDRTATVLMYVFLVVDVAIVALMVFKPGGG